MKLIFAQGNPGTEYISTRHNVGFFMLDQFAKKHNVTFASKPKFNAEIGELQSDGEKILLVKPTTFYNETGIAARALVDFYKLNPATDVLVLHDDMALPLGTIRSRLKGRDAGNNGIKSLNAHLGELYARIRIGIFNDTRHYMHATDFVLERFSATEIQVLPHIYAAIESFIEQFIAGQLEPTKVTIPVTPPKA